MSHTWPPRNGGTVRPVIITTALTPHHTTPHHTTPHTHTHTHTHTTHRGEVGWVGVCVYLDCEVVAGEDVTAAVAELDVRDGGYDLGEEGAGAGVLRLLKHCE